MTNKQNEDLERAKEMYEIAQFLYDISGSRKLVKSAAYDLLELANICRFMALDEDSGFWTRLGVFINYIIVAARYSVKMVILIVIESIKKN